MAQPYVNKAFELRDRVSERERLYISEKYYTYVTGEMDKTIEVLHTWSQLYPNDYIPRNNLAINAMFVGNFDEATKQALEAVRLSPMNITARDNLFESFLLSDRLDEAQKALDDLETLYPQANTVHFNRYFLAFLRGDHAAMDREVQWAKGKPVETDFIGYQAAEAEHAGQMKRAEELHLQQFERNKNGDRKENAARAMIAMATYQALVGKCEPAVANAEKGLSIIRGRETITSAALIFSACKDAIRAQPVIDEGLKLYPKDTIVAGVRTPWSNSLLEGARGNYADEVRILESLRRYDFGLFTGTGLTYCRGEAYLHQRSGKEAAAEFQAVIDHRGVEMFSPLHAIAHLGLARAAVLMNDSGKARKEYQDFFAMWKDADQDLPILIEAKKEYAALQ
jgi:tetratricopeptide (TPR) repeat protein